MKLQHIVTMHTNASIQLHGRRTDSMDLMHCKYITLTAWPSVDEVMYSVIHNVIELIWLYSLALCDRWNLNAEWYIHYAGDMIMCTGNTVMCIHANLLVTQEECIRCIQWEFDYMFYSSCIVPLGARLYSQGKKVWLNHLHDWAVLIHM